MPVFDKYFVFRFPMLTMITDVSNTSKASQSSEVVAMKSEDASLSEKGTLFFQVIF